MVIRGFQKYRRDARKAGKAAGDPKAAAQATGGLRKRIVEAKRAVKAAPRGTEARWDARVNRAQVRKDAGMRVHDRILRRVVR